MRVEIDTDQLVEGVKLGSRSWDGVDVTITEYCFSDAPCLGRICRPDASLLAIIEEVGGRAEFRMEPDTPIVGEYYGPGQLALLAPGPDLFLASGEIRRARLAALTFPADALRPASRVPFRNDGLHECMLLLAGEIVQEEETDAFGTGLVHAVIAAAKVAARERPDPNDFLPRPDFDRACAIVNDHLDEPLSVSELASAVGYPTEKFSALFRRSAGMPPQRWHLEERIRWAQRLLMETPSPSLREVAEWTGFSDQSHFSRVFGKLVGSTPTSWLKLHN